MCGLVGIFDTRTLRSVDRALLQRMNDSLWHRGPDAEGLHIEAGVGLGHRRLSIIDLSGGKQPLYNEDRSVVVVYNGEIYNFQPLMQELMALGHVFRTRCDTEVIVHAWEEWGERCVERFRGMFAFAIYDSNQQCLFLARDRVGIKPLYYSVLDDGQLIFGSELKSLLEHPGVARDIDMTAVEDYFAYGYVPDPKTILRGVFKLEPGHRVTFTRGKAYSDPRSYWEPPFCESDTTGNSNHDEELICRLREAVRIRMMADVPLGAFLSGGVDSSAVVAMMAGLSDAPVQTCSIGFDNPSFDEAEYAARVAESYNTDHQAKRVNSNDFELVHTLAGLYDEPFADSSALPTYRVCGLARERVTVALSGDGGDESFAGYRRYHWYLREEAVRRSVPLPVRRTIFGALGHVYPKLGRLPRFLRAKATFQALARDSVEGYFHSVSILDDELRAAIFNAQFKKNLQGYRAVEVLRSHAARGPDHPLSRVQYLDFKTYLPGDILTKVDRASMAHSLEVRVPILDHEFLEWVGGLPCSEKYANGIGKLAFKRALEPFVDKDILYRQKMGFAVPLGSWFRGPLRDHVQHRLLGSSLQDLGIFEMSNIQRIVRRHQRGAQDYSATLWSLLMFEAACSRLFFSDSHLDGPGIFTGSGTERGLTVGVTA